VCPQVRSAPPTEPCPQATVGAADPAPLSLRQLAVLASSVAREVVWGLRLGARELRKWRAHAGLIPDPAIRNDALGALAGKRGNTDGAALFWVIPRSRNRFLLKLLVTYQVMWDFLDNVSETGAVAGQANGRQLHLALIDAIDCKRPTSDYYRFHPGGDDGGYLRSLVETCREFSTRLPSFAVVRPLLVREARRAGVQAINHDLNSTRRDMTLREWVAREYADRDDAQWFELAAAAGAGLSIYALFALAANPKCGNEDMLVVYNAYFPWTSALATMLDSYVDRLEDAINGDHVYVDHYRSQTATQTGIVKLVRESLSAVGTLPNSERHRLLVASMIAMYLSKDSAIAQANGETADELLAAGGHLTQVLFPVLRLWRIVGSQRST
jgi:tetraprenyl-beta-curcumene synthase